MDGEHWFDTLSKGLAHTHSRRDSLKLAGVAVAALFLPRPSAAAAQSACHPSVVKLIACVKKEINNPANVSKYPSADWPQKALAALERLRAQACGAEAAKLCQEPLRLEESQLGCPGLKRHLVGIDEGAEKFCSDPKGLKSPQKSAAIILTKSMLKFAVEDEFNGCLMIAILAGCTGNVKLPGAGAIKIDKKVEGASCVGKVCFCGGDGPDACQVSNKLVTCVDKNSNASHCGECNRACAAGEFCVRGLCSPCKSGEKLCGTTCIAVGKCCGGPDCDGNPLGPLCCADGSCGACCPERAATCPSGQVCESGRCGCPSGFKLCETSCIPPDACCSAACPAAGQSCVNGNCACPAGQTVIEGRCTREGTCSDGIRNGPESDVDCGGDCPPCGDGKPCVRPQDCLSQTCCDGRCTTLGTEANCSACGDACAGGICCGGRCATLGTEANCSACGDACIGGRTCQGGVCACPTGQVVCGGTCSDTATDSANCGGCAGAGGRACPSGQVCQAGQCVSPPGTCNGRPCSGFCCRNGTSEVFTCCPGPCCGGGCCPGPQWRCGRNGFGTEICFVPR